MSIACPHCQSLIARDRHASALPADCPHCGKPMTTRDETAAASPSLATFLNTGPATVATRHEPPPDDTQGDAIATPVLAVVDAPPHEVPVEGVDVPATADDSHADDLHHVAMQDADAMPAEDLAHADALPEDASPAIADATPAIATHRVRKPNGPRFLHHARSLPVHARRARWQWTAVIALALLLCVQVVLADRARLATQAGWRPIVVALCSALRCDVPMWREPAAFTMLSRDVRPIVNQPGTLQAQATFRNEARWAQAWPVILLTLKDADGRTLGARALQPGDYLAEGEASSPIGPGQSAQMAVRIREPSANVVAFSFDFR